MDKKIIYWAIFWTIWINWLMIIASLASPENWKNTAISFVLVGLGGALGELLFQENLHETEEQQQKFDCALAFKWNVFWMVIYLLLFSMTNASCNRSYHPVSNPCGYQVFAMILLSPFACLYILLGFCVGDAICKKLLSPPAP
jgi:hypothetical protein